MPSPVKPERIKGIRIPGRDSSIRRRVTRLYSECDWLGPSDMEAAVRYVHLSRRFLRLAERLNVEDGLTADGGIRKADSELRALSVELRALESALSITVGAREENEQRRQMIWLQEGRKTLTEIKKINRQQTH